LGYRRRLASAKEGRGNFRGEFGHPLRLPAHPPVQLGAVPVDLRARGIDEAQAADLRARLKTFAEDVVLVAVMSDAKHFGHSLGTVELQIPKGEEHG
jgi:hypothetical protein